MDTVLKDSEMNRLVRVSIWTGHVAHLLDLDDPPTPGIAPERAPTLCGFKLMWPARWIGLDGIEPEDQASKPTCLQCTRFLEARGGKLP